MIHVSTFYAFILSYLVCLWKISCYFFIICQIMEYSRGAPGLWISCWPTFAICISLLSPPNLPPLLLLRQRCLPLSRPLLKHALLIWPARSDKWLQCQMLHSLCLCLINVEPFPTQCGHPVTPATRDWLKDPSPRREPRTAPAMSAPQLAHSPQLSLTPAAF